MPTWICEIVGSRPDGLLTWRREGATEPRGVLLPTVAPPAAQIGDRVTITATRDWSGQWDVESCELMPREDDTLEQHRSVPEVGPLTPACGQLHWTSVMNPLEDPLSQGKPRPAVLIADLGHSWRVMGLTTKDHYEDGTPRTPIPDFAAVGLHGPGYLWGKRLTRVRTSDVGDFIGTADLALLNAVLALAHHDLTPEERRELMSLVERRSP